MVLFWARPRSYLPLESQFAVKVLTEVIGCAIRVMVGVQGLVCAPKGLDITVVGERTESVR